MARAEQVESAAGAAGVLGFVRAAARIPVRLPALPWALLAVAWMGGIWWLSSRAVDTGPRTFAMRWLANLVHAPLFGLLCLWWSFALAPRAAPMHAPRAPHAAPVGGEIPALSVARALTAAGLATAWGIADEFHQAQVPERSATLLDVLTDVTAAVAVVWVVLHVSGASRSEAGTRLRLALGAAACLLASLLATL